MKVILQPWGFGATKKKYLKKTTLVNFQKLEKNPNTRAYKTNNCLILKWFVQHIKAGSSRLKVSWSLSFDIFMKAV